MKIKLKGVSLKGKNRVREQGDIWEFLCQKENVLFSSERGPWFLLQSLDGKNARWVRKDNDSNFEIVEVIR